MLYIVGVPIGNMQDLSPHAVTVLSSVDFILCEDTRRTLKLLRDANIEPPQLISCHAHNEQSRIERAIVELTAGKNGAYVSDAGTPAVSDPGMRLVAAAHSKNIPVIPVAGPSAVITALSVAGFETPPFHFLGFPPRKKSARQKWLTEASQYQGVLVLFESGKRFAALIEDLQELMSDREICLCRELTKTHQEIRRGNVMDFIADNVLGEVTLVIGPGRAVQSQEETMNTLKRIAQELGDEWCISKREAYNLLMSIKPDSDS